MGSNSLSHIVRCCMVLTLLTALAAPVHGEAVTIASWNIENLGEKSDIEQRAQVIEHFDIVALQEVEALKGLKNLVSQVETNTGVDWEYVASPLVGSGGAAEYYSFVYRTDRVTYIEDTSGVYPEPSPDDFSREPFYASFRAGSFDFTLITVHITWGLFARLRTEECRRLQSVWSYVQHLDPAEDDLILLGDFNRDKPTHSAFNPLEELGITPVLTAAGTRTTYGRTASGGNWYDHIWIDPDFTATELTADIGTGTPAQNAAGGGCPSPLRSASDHCPIWAVFDTTEDDDPVCE